MSAQEHPLLTQLRKGFDLGEWRIWPNAGQIEKDGQKHHIEPKLVEVLLLLARHPGQVLSREALLDHAWQRQVVCDEALTRTISELRTVLGDSGRERRYIRTVPKRGYSLIAEIRPLAETCAEETQSQVRARYQGPVNGGAWLPRESLTNRLIKYWFYGVGSLTTALSALLALAIVLADDVQVDVVPDPNWAALLASANELPKGFDTETPAPDWPKLQRYAVLPFSNLTPDHDLDFFTQGLEEDIRSALTTLNGAQVSGRLVSKQFQPRQENSVSSIQLPSIQEIGGQLNVDAIVDGTVRLIDGQIRVTVQLLDVKSGFPLWSKRYDQIFDRVLKLQTHISDDIADEFESRLPKNLYAIAAVLPKPQRGKEEESSLPAEEYGHTRHLEWLAR